MKKDTPFITGNQKIVRNINRAAILNLIREKQPISRIRIARITGLNKSTVSSIVQELIDNDFICETVEHDKQVGRNPINLTLKLNTHFVGGISIEAGETGLIIADIDGTPRASSTLPTRAREPEAFLQTCLRELRKLQQQHGIAHLTGLGVSVTGIVNQAQAHVIFSAQLGWEDVPVGAILRSHWSDERPVVVSNDARAAALAELWFGQHDRQFNNFVFLYIGEGIGSGIVIENKLIDGAHHLAGEFGHLTLFEGGERCSCGNYGCLEAYASDRATVKRFLLLSQREGPAGEESITLSEIIARARQGNPPALETLRQTGRYLGLGISKIIKTIDPEAIILDGEIIAAYDLILPEMTRAIEQRAFFGKTREVKILPASLQTDSRLLGAAALMIQKIFSDVKIVL